MTVANISASLLPVLLFLAALIYLDSYKLIKPRSIIIAIGVGCVAALVAYAADLAIMVYLRVEQSVFSKYFAPLVEEPLKAVYVIYLIRARKVGFMVDAALLGMAVGAGFACIENIIRLAPGMHIFACVIRGFGTALMHGGTTALVGVVARSLLDAYPSAPMRAFGMGLLLAAVIHSLFNHFFIDPVISTVLILIVLPQLMLFIFKHSEEVTRKWLGVGLDSDLELLNLLTTGDLSDSNIGKYLTSLKERFPPSIIGDMLCYVRLYTELAMRSKGILMMHENGFNVPKDPEIAGKFTELHFLEKSIGKTGRMAILPVLRVSSRNLWQLELLER